MKTGGLNTKAAERLYKFLHTTATRDGVGEIHIGILSMQNGHLLLMRKGEGYTLPCDRLKPRETMPQAIRRIARVHGMHKVHVKRYLGSWEENGVEGKKARGFGFEIDGETDGKASIRVAIGNLPAISLDPCTSAAVQKFLNK